MFSHIGLIMDGNRRWARQRGLPSFMGHKEGAQTVKKIIEHAIKQKIAWVSLYAFSIENLKRSEEEKTYLFNLLAKTFRDYLPSFMQQGIRVRFIGDRNLFPAVILHSCEHVEKETASCSTINVNILFCYGGQQEIIAATQTCMHRALESSLTPEQVTSDYFAQQLWSAPAPAPELIIRTGGMPRLSNFLLYQAAYSEILFTDTLWPDFSTQEFDDIMQKHQTIKRTLGK